MTIFNIIAGIASIISLLITIFVYNGVKKIILNMKIEDNSVRDINSFNKVSQKAKGQNITQSGGDLNVQ